MNKFETLRMVLTFAMVDFERITIAEVFNHPQGRLEITDGRWEIGDEKQMGDGR